MITLPEGFSEKNRALVDTPSYTVFLETDESLLSESTTQADWTNSPDFQNVDTSSEPGSVLLLAPSAQGNSGATGVFSIQEVNGDTGAITTYDLWQSFTPPGDGTLRRVRFLIEVDKYRQEVVVVEVWDSAQSVLLGGVEKVVSWGAEWWRTFDFPQDEENKIELTAGTTYWLKVYTRATTGTNVKVYYNQGGDPYPGGQMHTDPADDACFFVYFSYPSSGYIVTKTLDLGTTPRKDGEWIFEDTVPTGTSITYRAWASHTGEFTGEETDLGTVQDGDPITVRRRYYRVRAELSTTNTSLSPVLHSISAYFPEYLKLSNESSKGYEPSVLGISSLETTIHDFKPSTIGTVSLRLALTSAVGGYLTGKHPLGKRVIIRAGFADIDEKDYIHYYTGIVDRYRLEKEGVVVLNLKDASRSWKHKIPKKWENSGDDISWTDTHPVDCMLDIFERIGIRSAYIDKESFRSVKESLTGWKITRTLTGNTYSADKLLEELRILTSTYFIPRGDGKIRLKLYDPQEQAIAELTDDVLVSIGWSANTEELLNELYVYYGWNGSGDELKDFSALYVLLSAQSVSDWGPHQREIKDKWTPSKQGWQVEVMAQKLVERYSKKPALLEVELDRYFLMLEVGDLVTVTSSVPPGGINQGKFQIVRKNLDFSRDTVKLKLLEV